VAHKRKQELGRVKYLADHILPDWIKTEVRLRTKYRRMRVGDVGDYSFVPYDKYQCIFVHIPKTAGVSVAKALFGNLGGGHIPIRTLQRVFGAETLARYFKFTFVRNPYDRLLSAFTFLKTGGMDLDDRIFAEKEIQHFETFHDFVKTWVTEENVKRNLHFIPQVDWLRLNDTSVAVDFIGRYENLSQDFDRVCRHLKIPSHLSKANASKRARDYRQYYDEESMRIVRRVYCQDLGLFNYEFEPAQR